MATAAVVGLAAGKRLLTSSFYTCDLSEKLLAPQDHGIGQFSPVPSKCLVLAKKDPKDRKRCPSNRQPQAIRAIQEAADCPLSTSTTEPSAGEGGLDPSLDILLLLQKSMLEKQWSLSYDPAIWKGEFPGERAGVIDVVRSGSSARERRKNGRRNCWSSGSCLQRRRKSVINSELMRSKSYGYVRGVAKQQLLGHDDVVCLSKKIKAALFVEARKKRLKLKLGCEPSDKQLALSLNISPTELCSKMVESSLAREILAMSNVRLVISIAQKYDNLGVELADLIQGGLMGLLRGIEKFDSSKGYRISTYVYWWIRQGVSKALLENSRTLRLPAHLHDRLFSIRIAKAKLEERGITPSLDKIAETLNISKKKVKNATEADSKVYSLDREPFPALNGLPTDSFHSYIADNHHENSPWVGFEEWSLKDEVHRLLDAALNEREREVICLYYGLGKPSHTWEDIGKRFGLSRERVRQVGLVAVDKLKHAARKKRLDAMMIKQLDETSTRNLFYALRSYAVRSRS